LNVLGRALADAQSRVFASLSGYRSGWDRLSVAEALEQSPIGTIVSAVREQLPGVEIERGASMYPLTDPNGWWIFRWNGTEVSMSNHPEGKPPFLVDHDGKDWRLHDPSKAVDRIVLLLSTP
jgi:hypothetical protein